MKRRIKLNNGIINADADPIRRLIDVLRYDLQLTGTKEGCGEGECGACSIILNGECVNSCIILFGQIEDGDEILTVEGLLKDGKLSRLQESFVKNGAVHCGACIPGMLLSATALLNKNLKPTDEEIKDSISGNLCRCTGYGKIIKAIRECI
ncbi:MAG: (2Fe-2S)-binding protein [Deltaproteobacteria bacterium]|nr:(2Fe-2S)-binding protein [Deltaproteobacteria bacterium]